MTTFQISFDDGKTFVDCDATDVEPVYDDCLTAITFTAPDDVVEQLTQRVDTDAIVIAKLPELADHPLVGFVRRQGYWIRIDRADGR